MSKELVISADRHETRVAVIEDDQVVEVYHQRENEYSLAGSIHKGRVTRVLPGMQSAFVDIGLGRDAFLYVSDFFEDNEEYDKIVTSVEEKVLKLDRTPAPQAQEAPVEPAPEAEPAAGDAVETAAAESAFPAVAPLVVADAVPGAAERAAHVPAEPLEAAPARDSQDDDFFVLPGESLAKYTEPAGALEEDVEEPAVEEVEEVAESAEPAEPEAATEPVVQAAAEMPAEPAAKR